MKDYQRYRWFYTSSDALVVGGKNAVQNDELLNKLLAGNKDYWVMHTRAPGSPFCVIVKDMNKVTKEDLEECAVFTGCFSRAWRAGAREAKIDIFTLKQLSKDKTMNPGMWRVTGQIEHRNVSLRLALSVQKKILRAVPPASAEEPLIFVSPGNMDKTEMAAQFGVEIGDKFTKEEIIAALPAGGVKKVK